MSVPKNPPHTALPLLVVTKNQDQEFLATLLAEWSLRRDHSEMIWLGEAEPITIDDIRALQQQLSYVNLGLPRVVIFAHLESASVPAQQALLKTVEEPPADTYLLLVTRQLQRVLPTLQSRCRVKWVEQTPPSTQLPANADINALYEQLRTATASDIFTISQQYTKKEPALTVIEDLLTLLDTRLQSSTNPDFEVITYQLQTLLTAYEQVLQAATPRLVLEQCWLQWLSKRRAQSR